MRIPVYRLMSAGQNDLLRSALLPIERLLGVSWDYRDGTGPDGLSYLCGLPASKLLGERPGRTTTATHSRVGLRSWTVSNVEEWIRPSFIGSTADHM